MTKTVKVGSLHLAYEEIIPDDPAGSVLLLTGLGGNKTSWYGHTNTFGRYFRTIAVDYRDTGESDKFREPYTLQDQVNDMTGFIEALNLGRTHLIGVSMGGFIALELALTAPELVRSLILVSTRSGGINDISPIPEIVEVLERKQGEGAGAHLERCYPVLATPGFFDKYRQRLKVLVENADKNGMSYEAYNRQKASADKWGLNSDLPGINVPTLIIHGSDDLLVPPENARILASKIRCAELIMLPNCGHLVTMEKSREFTTATLEFFQEIRDQKDCTA